MAKEKSPVDGINGIDHKIPYRSSTTTLTIDTEGTPKVLIKLNDGKIDKLLTDEEFRKIIIDKEDIKKT